MVRGWLPAKLKLKALVSNAAQKKYLGRKNWFFLV